MEPTILCQECGQSNPASTYYHEHDAYVHTFYRWDGDTMVACREETDRYDDQGWCCSFCHERTDSTTALLLDAFAGRT